MHGSSTGDSNCSSETTQVWRILARTAPETCNPSLAPHDAEARFEAAQGAKVVLQRQSGAFLIICVNCDVQALWRNRGDLQGTRERKGNGWFVCLFLHGVVCFRILGPVASGQSKFIRAVAQKSSKAAFLAF